MKAILIGGAAVLVAGMTALALTQERRDTPAQPPEVVPAAVPEAPAAILADPGTLPPPPEELPAPDPVAKPGYQVDPDGFVWEPLSYDKPQIKNNGDGTITMKKLARIVQDGVVRETPITVTASPTQRRMPLRKRGDPVPKAEPSEQSVDSSLDGE